MERPTWEQLPRAAPTAVAEADKVAHASEEASGVSAIITNVFGWITTTEQAASTAAGACLLGVGDAAVDLFPHADIYGSAGLGGLGGLSLMLAAQSVNNLRSRRRAREHERREAELQETVKTLVRLLADRGFMKFGYELEDTYRLFLARVVDLNELEAWIEVARDRLRLSHGPAPTVES